ncbi:MAG: hypothetical protein MJZ01_02755 [Bacteroidales bacterium]|nr:hypothetical protein [Bacteroidales bacterium]
MAKKLSLLLLAMLGIMQAWATDTKTKTLPDSLVFDNNCKFVYTYDEDHRQIAESFLYKEDGKWVEKKKVKIEYFQNDLIKSHEVSELVDGEWVVTYRKDCTYNEKLYETSRIEESFDKTGALTDGTKYEKENYSYDENSYSYTQTTYRKSKDEWEFSERHDYTRDYKDNVLVDQRYYYTDYNDEIVFDSRWEYSYDENGNLLVSQSFELVDEELKPYIRSEYKVNENGKRVQAFYSYCYGYIEGIWTGSISEYDDNGDNATFTYINRTYDNNIKGYVLEKRVTIPGENEYSTVTYRLDDNGEWILHLESKDITEYVRNADGSYTTIEIISESTDHTTWVAKEKYEEAFDAKGNKLMEQDYTLDNGELKPSRRTEYFINEKGESIKIYNESFYRYQNGMWTGYTYTYDNEGHMANGTYIHYDYYEDCFKKEESTYNENEQQMSCITSNLDGDKWVATEKEENEYDMYGRNISKIKYSITNGVETPISKNVYSYDTGGRELIECIYSRYGEEWILTYGSTKYEPTYTDGVLTSSLKYEWNGTEWVESDIKIEYSYDDKGIRTALQYEHNGSEWELINKSEAAFDAKGNMVMNQSYLYDDGELKPYERTKYFINEKGECIIIYDENFNGYPNGMWIGDTYTYDNEGNKIGETDMGFSGTYDSETGSYVYSYYRREYTYDEGGNQLSYTRLELKDGEWIVTDKSEYSYDDNGNRLESNTYKSVNGELKLSEKRKYAIDEKGYVVQVYGMYGSFTKDGKWTGMIETDDINGHMISYEYTYSDGTGFGEFYEWTYDEEKDAWNRTETSHYTANTFNLGEKFHYTPNRENDYDDVTLTFWDEETSSWSENVIKGVYYYDGIADAISDIQSDKQSSVAYGLKNAIRIENALDNDVVIYNINGAVVACVKKCNEATVNVGSKGIYVVKIGNETHKVVVK